MDINVILRKDFTSYVKRVFLFLHPEDELINSWHIKCVTSFIQEYNKIIVNLPPRTLKSIICTIAYSTWIIGKKRSSKVIIATYGDFLSKTFLEYCKLIIDSDWYQDLFSDFIIISKTSRKIINNYLGHIIVTSINGPITGEGCDILIIDDPHKAIDAYSSHMLHKTSNWFENTLLSRLNNFEKGKIIIVMQRIHKFDLTGYVLENFNIFFHLKIPYFSYIDIIFKAKNDIFLMKENSYLYSYFQDITKNLTQDVIQAQYLQNPISNLELFDVSKIQVLEDVFKDGQIYQSWDTAISQNDNSSYSVCTVWKISAKKYMLIDFFKDKVSYRDLLYYANTFANKYPYSFILIENKFTGCVLIEDLSQYQRVIPINPIMSKYQRAMRVSGILNSVCISDKLKLNLRKTFLRDLAIFPYGKSDDVVDSFSQFLLYIRFSSVFLR